MNSSDAVRTWKEEIFGIVRTLLIALVIVVPIRFFVAQPFIVRGASMEPNFHDGEYLVIDEISYRFQNPERGDVIVFRYPNDTQQFFIKRIVGLPGETITIRSGSITIRDSSGEEMLLREPYLNPGEVTVSAGTFELDEGEYFVLGDNRAHSSDSRAWGPLEERHFIGRAFVRLFPLHRISLF